MKRGTTPFITINTDQDLTGYEYIVFTMEDRVGNEVNVDNGSDAMQVNPDSVVVRLSQDQTLSMTKGGVKMQVRARDSAGYAIASNIMTANMEDILRDGVI